MRALLALAALVAGVAGCPSTAHAAPPPPLDLTSSATSATLADDAGGAPLPDLTLSMAGPSSVPASAPMAYSLTVDNIGTAGATGVTVVVTLPSGLTAVSAAGTNLFACSVSGVTVTCTGAAINQGSSATISIQATAPAATGSITSTAAVDPDDTIAESDELNNTAALANTQVTAAPPPSDLSIDMEDSPDPVNPGQPLTYTITATNGSEGQASNVVVTAVTQGLDPGSLTASQSVSGGAAPSLGGCTVAAPHASCSIATLDPGATMTVRVSGTVVAPAGASIQGSATVTGHLLNTSVTNTDTEVTTVLPAVDLVITQTGSPDPVCASSWPGDAAPSGVCQGGLIYTLLVGNGGTDEATNVTVRDRLPAGAIFDSFEAPDFAGGCAVSADNVVTCTLGTIPPQSTASITLVLVAPDVAGPISNTAIVDPNNTIHEADETNNRSTVTTMIVPGADLVVHVDDVLDPVATAGTLTYVITVDNLGPQDVFGIRVHDVLPVGAVLLSAAGDSGFTCVPAGAVVECLGGYLPGTASKHYPPFGGSGDAAATIVVRVFAREYTGTGPQGMLNQVWVDPLDAVAEVNELNNWDFEYTDVVVGGAALGAFNQLTIDKTQVYPPNPVARNAEVVYHVVVGNDGTDPAVNIQVFDEPPRLSRVIEIRDISDHGFLCYHSDSNDIGNCMGGWVEPGGTATIEVRVFAPDIPGLYAQQSFADPLDTIPEGNELDNASNVVTAVVNGGNGPFYDLALHKSGTPIATPGGALTYLIHVWNQGSTLISNVRVSDFLPAGVTLISAHDTAPGAPGSFICGDVLDILECIGGTLPPGLGGARTIVISALAPNREGILVNEAMVDPANEVPEGDEANNTGAAVTLVRSNINLRIAQAGPTVATQGTVAEYVITVENEEPAPGAGQTAFGVQVRDPLPLGVTPLAIDTGPGNNWACQVWQNPIHVVDCTGDLDPGRPVTIRITVQVTAATGRSLDNEACVDPEDHLVEIDPPGKTDNCSTHTSPIEPLRRSPDLVVTKSADREATAPGQSLTYTITVTNAGDADAVGPITVVDELPSSVAFVGAVAPPGWTCSHAAGVVTCHDPPAPNDGLASGASRQIEIRAYVRWNAALPIVNTVSVRPARADIVTEPDTAHEQDLADNTATVVTSLPGSGLDLAIASITENPDPIDRGYPLVHTIVAVNGGDQVASGVHVQIGLPPSGLVVLDVAGTSGFACGPPTGGKIDCAGDLPAGGSAVFAVTSLVLLSAPSALTLTATIDPDGAFAEPSETNNTQSEATAVSGAPCATTPCIDLVAARLVPSAAEPRAGDAVTFDLVVVNAGSSPAQMPDPADPLIYFDLFGNVTLQSYASSSPAITCGTSPSSIPGKSLLSGCTGQLAPGERVTLSIAVTVNSGASVTAVGLADPTNRIAEHVDFASAPPHGNNRISRTIAIKP